MEKKYVLAIDQSTQGTKALLFDRAGKAVAREDIPHKQIINENGWVSHDLNEIYSNTIESVKRLLKQTKTDPEEIDCIGISNQRETSAVWDRKTGEPLAEAVVWQCARAQSISDRIRRQGCSEMIRSRTGLNLSPYFPASKYAWLLENIPQLKAKQEQESLCFGTIDTWLLFRLTGGQCYKTDYSNASRTQLYNIRSLCWDTDICALFGIEPGLLPEVCESGSMLGTTGLEGTFPEPVPICAMIGDSQAALFGQGCIRQGMIKSTYGTGSSVMMNTGSYPDNHETGLVTSIAWGINGTVDYVLEGNINYTGAVVTWLKDDMGLIQSPGETESLARDASPVDNCYLVPAFTGLGAPYWNSQARAVISGMSRTTGKKEIVRAALESIAYQITDIVTLMKDQTGIDIQELCVDGGPTKNHYLMKFQSDILNIPVTLPKCEESSAQGAAYLAGLTSGFYDDNELFKRSERTQFLPEMEERDRSEKYKGWKQAVARVLI